MGEPLDELEEVDELQELAKAVKAKPAVRNQGHTTITEKQGVLIGLLIVGGLFVLFKAMTPQTATLNNRNPSPTAPDLDLDNRKFKQAESRRLLEDSVRSGLFASVDFNACVVRVSPLRWRSLDLNTKRGILKACQQAMPIGAKVCSDRDDTVFAEVDFLGGQKIAY